ncbi:MAG TPA: hypothetical protein DC064_12910 [Cyanobacteria bacterium UBA9273]|nr:hypothetical protein [Cyanobacteria bacterium UBA9273]
MFFLINHAKLKKLNSKLRQKATRNSVYYFILIFLLKKVFLAFCVYDYLSCKVESAALHLA